MTSPIPYVDLKLRSARWARYQGWMISLIGIAALLLGWLIWRRAVSTGWIPWSRHDAYLLAYRPGTYWTWTLDPGGVLLLMQVLVGCLIQHRLWAERPTSTWVQPGWVVFGLVLAIWYSGCAFQLLVAPLVW